MIELSVALPLYNSGKIVWLALESLINQKNIDFEWELVVCEEQNEKMLGGLKLMKQYGDKIKNIKYLPLKKWLSLGEKWKYIAKNCDKNSKCFLLQAADCYSQPYRLKATYEAIVKNNYDWYKSNIGLFYNIKTKKYILYKDLTNIQKGGLNMAMKTQDVINKVPDEYRRAVVDGWLYKHINPQKVFIDTNSYFLNGVDTHGYNQISIKREKFFNNPSFPFEKVDFEANLPEEIIDRLQLLT
jgi:glycosyltransferase involved in cell wall biosynthesis